MAAEVKLKYDDSQAVEALKRLATATAQTADKARALGASVDATDTKINRMGGRASLSVETLDKFKDAFDKGEAAAKRFAAGQDKASESAKAGSSVVGDLTKRFLTFEAAKQVVGSALGYINERFRATTDEGVEPFQISLEYAWGQLDKWFTGVNAFDLTKVRDEIKKTTAALEQIDSIGKGDTLKAQADQLGDADQIDKAIAKQREYIQSQQDLLKAGDSSINPRELEKNIAEALAKVQAYYARRKELEAKAAEMGKALDSVTAAQADPEHKREAEAYAKQLTTVWEIRKAQQDIINSATNGYNSSRLDEAATKDHLQAMGILEARLAEIKAKAQEDEKKRKEQIASQIKAANDAEWSAVLAMGEATVQTDAKKLETIKEVREEINGTIEQMKAEAAQGKLNDDRRVMAQQQLNALQGRFNELKEKEKETQAEIKARQDEFVGLIGGQKQGLTEMLKIKEAAETPGTAPAAAANLGGDSGNPYEVGPDGRPKRKKTGNPYTDVIGGMLAGTSATLVGGLDLAMNERNGRQQMRDRINAENGGKFQFDNSPAGQLLQVADGSKDLAKSIIDEGVKRGTLSRDTAEAMRKAVDIMAKQAEDAEAANAMMAELNRSLDELKRRAYTNARVGGFYDTAARLRAQRYAE